MNYPIISEYIEAIKLAEDNFGELSWLRPVFDDNGEPVMSSGNFAVVFKMKSLGSSKFHAVKCFLREQPNRAESYKMIEKELENVSSPYLTFIRFLDKELYVDSKNSDEKEFPVLLMDWVEGVTLDEYIRSEHEDKKYLLECIAHKFSKLAMWLIPQPFAHGDLKLDNIIVRNDGSLVLVDYDGMYVPDMKGQKAREIGSPAFRHPLRTEDEFNEHIDDFSCISILLSLRAIAYDPSLLDRYGAKDRLLLTETDYIDISSCKFLKEEFPSKDSDLNMLYSLFVVALEKDSLYGIPLSWLNIEKPVPPELWDDMVRHMEEEHAPYEIAKKWPFKDFVKNNKFTKFNVTRGYRDSVGDWADCLVLRKENGDSIVVFEQSTCTDLCLEEIKKDIKNGTLEIALSRAGDYIIYYNNAVDIDSLPFK